MALTLREYATLSPAQAALVSLPGTKHGVLMCTDETGARVTVVGTGDAVRFVRELRVGVSAPAGNLNELFPFRRDGWPDDWALDAAGHG